MQKILLPWDLFSQKDLLNAIEKAERRILRERKIKDKLNLLNKSGN